MHGASRWEAVQSPGAVWRQVERIPARRVYRAGSPLAVSISLKTVWHWICEKDADLALLLAEC